VIHFLLVAEAENREAAIAYFWSHLVSNDAEKLSPSDLVEWLTLVAVARAFAQLVRPWHDEKAAASTEAAKQAASMKIATAKVAAAEIALFVHLHGKPLRATVRDLSLD
jgi:hypothetical protein